MRKNLMRFFNLGLFVVMVVLNILAATGVLGNIRTENVSALYPSMLTPAPVSFSIWSVIYVLLMVMVVYQISDWKNGRGYEVRENLGITFMISCLANIAWILAWQFLQIELSFAFIAVLLVLLIKLLMSIDFKHYIVSIPVGIYAGWISVATLANLAVVYSKNSWNFFGIPNVVWAVIGLILGGMLICYVVFKTSNSFYSIAAAWGYMGIAIASGTNTVGITALVGVVAFAAMAIIALMPCFKSCSGSLE